MGHDQHLLELFERSLDAANCSKGATPPVIADHQFAANATAIFWVETPASGGHSITELAQ